MKPWGAGRGEGILDLPFLPNGSWGTNSMPCTSCSWGGGWGGGLPATGSLEVMGMSCFEFFTSCNGKEEISWYCTTCNQVQLYNVQFLYCTTGNQRFYDLRYLKSEGVEFPVLHHALANRRMEFSCLSLHAPGRREFLCLSLPATLRKEGISCFACHALPATGR